MLLSKFENGINRFSLWCNWISCIAVLIMMCIVCANVILHFFDMPILGAHEYVTLISTVIISFGLAHTGVIKGHVAVDLVMRRFSERTQAIVSSITGIVAIIIFAIIMWWMAKYGYNNFKLNLATETMEIPIYPFIFVISFGFLIYLIVLIVEFFNSIVMVFKK
ncbi:MAG: TRAP transporter small permease [Deltaproteobacteria bacterium]|nr:TRAP transporter small permease [Deltaproteobacteria bacterium]